MERFNPKIEHEPTPKDISSEFLNILSWDEFDDFLTTQAGEPSLSITIDWKDVPTAERLKGFIEDSHKPKKQKRYATIRATQEQHDRAVNAFLSGVKWEKV